MDAPQPLDFQLAGVLTCTDLTLDECAMVAEICQWVVEVVPQLDVPDHDVASGSAAQLFLDQRLPCLEPPLRDEFARLCAEAVST